jgi:hypothetical protein
MSSFYDKLKKETSEKYLNRYVPKSLSKEQKEEVSKIILDRRAGKSNKITPSFNRQPRRSTYTVQFNKRFDIKDKSLKNLSKYFKIQPAVLNTIYDKGSAAWNTSGSRLGVGREAWSKARVYKAILNILDGRKNGIDKYPRKLQTEGHDYSLVKKAIQFNNFIPKEINK